MLHLYNIKAVIIVYMKTTISRAEAKLSAERKAFMRSIGLVLRSVRTGRGITREDAARRLLINRHTLGRMEMGDPRASFGYYLAYADLLGVPLVNESGLVVAATAHTAKTQPRAHRLGTAARAKRFE